MIFKIIKYEFKLLKLELLIVILIFSLALFLSFANSSYKLEQYKSIFENINLSEVKQFSDSKKEAESIEKEMLKNKEDLSTNRTGVRSPSNIGNKGLNIMLKPQDSFIFSIGQYDLYTVNYIIKNSGKDESIQNTENPLNLLIGNFDPSFVILYLYPIFIIVLSFDFLSSEREKGILKLLLTQSISLKTLIVSKILARATIIFLTTISLIILSIYIFNINMFYGENMIKILLFLISTILYGLFWFFICILVNLTRNKSQTNVTILSSLWLLFLLIIPSVINLCANVIYPIPSRINYIESINAASEEERLKGAKILGKFMEDHPELVNKKIDTSKASVLKAIRDEQINKKINPVKDIYDKQINKQKDFISNFRYISPSIILQELIYDISESGYKSFRSFLLQSDNFQKEWRKFFITKVFNSEPMYSKDYDFIPKFQMKNNFNETVSTFIVSIIYLSSIILLLFLFINISYKKYQFND